MKVQDLNVSGGVGDGAPLGNASRFALGTSFAGILSWRVQRLGTCCGPRVVALIYYISWAEAVGG